MLLADLASEQESFEEALKDLRKALALLQPVVKVAQALLSIRASWEEGSPQRRSCELYELGFGK